MLRAQADVQNIRRRAEQDVSKARKFALERFAEELLPVVDNLERGLDSAQNDNADVKVIREGVELTLNSFMSVLKKFNGNPLIISHWRAKHGDVVLSNIPCTAIVPCHRSNL